MMGYLKPSERQLYGVTATLVDIATGELRTEVFRGRMGVGDATRACADYCDRLGPGWKVRTLSTPVSILSDLQNNGMERPKLIRTEHTLLGRIGRADLIESRAKWDGMKQHARDGRRRKA